LSVHGSNKTVGNCKTKTQPSIDRSISKAMERLKHRCVLINGYAGSVINNVYVGIVDLSMGEDAN
jgi:hypothetical protein